MSSKQAIGDKSAHTKAANRILIVDDEESLTFFLKQSLLEADSTWAIDTASTGEEAVLRINRSQYGLIIADLKMPALSGLELLQMVHALEPNTRVILMTAYGSEKVEKEAQRLSAYRYVTKPFRTEDMKQWAKDALREFEQAGPRLSRASRESAENQARKRTQESAEASPIPAAEKAAPATTAPQQGRVSAYLTRLRFLVGAQLVLLANAKGEVLASAGALRELDVAKFASLAASEFQATLAANAALGAGSAATMIVQSGQKFNASSVRVGSDGLLIILSDRVAQSPHWDLWPSPIRRAAEDLQALIVAAPPLSAEVGGNKNPRQELRELLYMPFPGKPEGLSPKQANSLPGKESLAPSPRKRSPEPANPAEDWTEETGDFSTLSEQGISIEDARTMGIISDDVLSRLIGDESAKS